MEPRRIKNPVTITFDGEKLVAEAGEPLVCALVAAGKLALARSPKFHRPRGPSCLRGACDGCLARVDDTPNVMTCSVAVRDGMDVRTQNTLGSRRVDLLRATDWFFPEGMNHHELFAGVPGVQALMQTFARRIAGLGRLPAESVARRPASRRAADVLVVGAGPAGMAVAGRAAERGRTVEILDDALAVGGGTRALGPEDSAAWTPLLDAFARAQGGARIRVRTSTTAGALYGDDLLVVGPEGAEIVTARALVLATGAHDGVLAFEGNDVPGVMSARAAGWLLRYGVAVGARIVVVVPDGGGPFGEAYARAVKEAGAPSEVTVVHGEPVRAVGNARVTACVVRVGGEEREMEADALVIDAPRAPSYELVEQAGAPLVHHARGYIPRVTAGKVREGVWAVGEVTGAPFDVEAIERAAADVAAQM